MGNRVKILAYYAGLRNLNESAGGACKALVSFVRLLKKIRPDVHIDIVGDLVKDDEIITEDIILRKTPSDNLEVFLSKYDMFFSVMHLGVFQNVSKVPNQLWIHLEHCWNKSESLSGREYDFDAVVALSDIHKKNLSAQGFELEKIHIVSNSLDDVFSSKKNVARMPNSLMFAGALVKHKGVDKLIAAFKLVKEKYPDAVLDIYGDDKIWRDKQNLISLDKNVLEKDDIFIKGAVSYSEMPKVYAAHSVLVLPSVLESFSLVSAEAQTQGCIPIVHDTGGVSAVVEDWKTGFLYKPNDPDVLSKKIIEVLSLLDKNPEIRKRTIFSAQNSFFSSNISTSIIKLFDNLETQLKEKIS